MSRRIITIIFVVGLAATFFFYPKSKSYEVLGMPNFTSITRTNTPQPVPPTATKKSDNGGTNPPAPQDTSTPVPPANTATPTLIPVTLAPTPIGGFLPTAVACGFPPTVQAQNTTRVRTGPGTDYEIISELVYLETRPIVGRAANAEWWIIQLTNEQTGWVANAVVIVHGNTSGIPLIPAPPINGTEPTPGPLWNPTPNPECPILPTPTPMPTATASYTPEPPPTVTETVPPTETSAAEPTATSESDESTLPPTEEVEPTATATSVVPTAEITQVDIEAESLQPTAEPLDGDETPSAVSALPCASAMIGVALVGFLVFRRFF